MSAVAAVRLGRFDAGSSAWHEARRGRIGGSEIAAVVGLSPWQSRFSLWHEKAGLLSPPPQDDDTFKTELGTVLEDGVARLFLNRNGGHLQRTGMWAHKDRPWQVAAPDRFRVPTPRSHRPTGILECKTADSGDHWQWGRDGGDQDDVPPYYAAQTLWYLDVFGFSEGVLAVLIGAREYRQYTIRYSVSDAEFLRAQARGFLDSIERGEAPAIDGHDATYQAIRSMHPEIDGDSVEIDHVMAQAYADAIGAVKVAEDAKRAATSAIAGAMGNAQAAWCNGVKIATRLSKNGGSPYVQVVRGLPSVIPTERAAA